MDYKSYKAMCDSTLQQIRKSENKREELNNKLQKMYQEKSECEKSIIKTLESQQKQFMEEKRRRAERNENILRTLERIDYQAQLLAAKTERLRALKKQYERYLLSLWATRRVAVYPPSSPSNFHTYARPFTARYEELPVHQSSHCGAGPSQQLFIANPPSASSPFTYQHNQSLYGEAPSTPVVMSAVENSIKSGNYQRGMDGSSYPSASSHQVRYDYAPLSSYHQPPPSAPSGDARNDKKKSFHLSGDNAINIGEMSTPTTINSIYSQHQLMPQTPPLDETSAPFYSIHQRHNQPLKAALHENPLTPPPTQIAAAVADLKLSSHPHSDTDADSESDQMAATAANHVRQLEIPHFVDATAVDASLQSIKTSGPEATTATAAVVERGADDDDDASMHQVWEKKVVEAEPSDAQQHHFVIPKIIVETQIDLSEASAGVGAVAHESESAVEKQDSDTPEKLLNQTSFEMEKHSADNRQNGSTSSASAAYSEQAGGESTIYHYDKQPPHSGSPDEQQQQQQQQQAYQRPQSSVEYELRNFDDIKISPSPHDAPMTCDSEINGNNSLTEGETINNINDDRNQKTSPSPPPTSAVLNDKISEIYRKIEKIEGEYYGEKGKIMENFERRLSATSLNDEAKAEAQSMENKYDDADASELPSSGPQQNADIMASNDMQQQQQQQFYVDESGGNVIYENQSETTTTEAESAENAEMQQSQRDTQSNYNYQHQDFTETGEQQQQQQQSDQYDYSENRQSIFAENEANSGGELHATSVEQYSYEPMQYQDGYALEPEQQDDYVYSHQQQQQQQQQYEMGNYNQQQSDSNYQQHDTYEPVESSSDYANESGGAYYDYDTSSQHYAPSNAIDAIDENDPNYSHQQAPEYQAGSAVDVEASSQANEYFQPPDGDSVYHQTQPIESNYSSAGETPIEMHAAPYDTNEYQSTTDGSYTLENANFDSQQHLASNDGLEQADASDASSSVSLARPLEPIEGAESAAPAPTKRDDVKLVKQLLDSESDDTASRSNLLQTAIKEEADESDFDFSTN